ncbi:hypothetical protein BDZ89DRAFT_219752 [Hymenopellis radicata]|nr:hypothetical protein BDZ89DRAFT_219752 [Hymenopellis radicata]
MFFPPVLLFASFLQLIAPVQAAAPTLTHLFNGTLFLEPVAELVPGPFGGRSLITFNGGTLLHPINGKVIANLIPGLGGELGALGSNNVFYPDARAALQWVDDSTYGYLEMHGSGKFGVKATTYARFETNSPSRVALNGLFTILRLDLSSLSPATFDIYSVVSHLDFSVLDLLHNTQTKDDIIDN